MQARKRYSEKELEDVRARLAVYGDRYPPNEHEADCLTAALMLNSLIEAEREIDAVKAELRQAYDDLAEAAP